MNRIHLPSYAKINLGLIIKGQRDDGFHEIETLLQQISLRDHITLESKQDPGIVFYCDSQGVPQADNSCIAAAQLVSGIAGVERGLEITLKKVIPIGAGLGGGSSNGATVLLGLNKLWNLGLGSETLLDLAAQIGSDVPFFIRGGMALAQGRGEILTPCAAILNFTFLIVFPGVAIETKWAYEQANLNLTMNKKSCTLASFKDINFNNVDFSNAFHNEFEDIIFPNYPLVKKAKDAILACRPVFASMSGSGSSVFGIFQTDDQARQARESLRCEYDSFVVRSVAWGYSSELSSTPWV